MSAGGEADPGRLAQSHRSCSSLGSASSRLRRTLDIKQIRRERQGKVSTPARERVHKLTLALAESTRCHGRRTLPLLVCFTACGIGGEKREKKKKRWALVTRRLAVTQAGVTWSPSPLPPPHGSKVSEQSCPAFITSSLYAFFIISSINIPLSGL